MVKIRGRLHIYPDVGDKLQSEWNAIQARRLFVRAVAARMVQRGALEESAKRQIRRWLRETGSKKGCVGGGFGLVYSPTPLGGRWNHSIAPSLGASRGGD